MENTSEIGKWDDIEGSGLFKIHRSARSDIQMNKESTPPQPVSTFNKNSGTHKSHDPLQRFIDILLQDAHKQGAEEIHIVTSPETLSVKYMLDGDIKEAMAPPLFMKPQLVGTLRRYFAVAENDPPIKSGATQRGVLEKRYNGNAGSRFELEPFKDDARFIVIMVEPIS